MSKFIGAVLVIFIKIYKYTLSPFFGNACRFQPTCSQYGTEAIQKYGPWKGGYLTLRRILSCHPWGKHGYDPVP